jgi:hypothetical protein
MISGECISYGAAARAAGGVFVVWRKPGTLGQSARTVHMNK